MKTKFAIVALSAFIAGSLFSLLPSIHAQQSTNAPAYGKHPLMRGALVDLQHAKAKLAEGTDEFGGHRVAALKACETAIAEVRAGLKFAEERH